MNFSEDLPGHVLALHEHYLSVVDDMRVRQDEFFTRESYILAEDHDPAPCGPKETTESILYKRLGK
jgi:hypothetical protein